MAVRERRDMAVGIILEFDGSVGKAQYDAVNGKLGLDPVKGTGDWPKGLLTHAGGIVDGGGFVVVETWDSKASQEAFMSGKLGAALGEVGVPAPVRVTWFDVAGQHTA